MTSQEEQLSHQQKLQNARSTRGHRRTQSNSQYDFTQLKVAPQLSEEEKKNKEDFEKMIQFNRIIDASSTVQALDAQKHNQEEKKTIVDCIDEDFSAQQSSSGSSSGSSMFNFGKNLHKKKRHNSDVGTLSRNDSSLLSSQNEKDKANEGSQFRTKRINDYDEDDEEADDDFDSMFFQKYKKFGHSNASNGFPFPQQYDGLYSIPELANSSEFGTSINKDNQSLPSHKKSLVNTAKQLNTHPSNSSSTDFTSEQVNQLKNIQPSPSSFLNGLNQAQNNQQQQQQQQTQQDILHQQILKQQQQEYEIAKQNYQINQMLRQQQIHQQTKSLLNNVSKQIESAQPTHNRQMQSQSQLPSDNKTISLQKTIPSNPQNTQNKSNEQAKEIPITQPAKGQKSLSHSPLSSNNIFHSYNLPNSQQNTSPLPQTQTTSPNQNNRNTQNPSPNSQNTFLQSNQHGQITKNLNQASQQVNPSLVSSSNISQYHHSRVESSSSQFCAQNYINDMKDSNISRASKRNSIHEIFNSGSSYTIPSLQNQSGQQMPFQRFSTTDNKQINNLTTDGGSGRISNLSESNRPSQIVQSLNYQSNDHSNKENSPLTQSTAVNQYNLPLFPPKMNLLLNKTSIDRKEIVKQRYSQSQNDSEEQHSMIDTVTSPKEGRVSPIQNTQSTQSTNIRTDITIGEPESQKERSKISSSNLNLPLQSQSSAYQHSQSSTTSQNSANQMNFSNQLNFQANNNGQKSQRSLINDPGNQLQLSTSHSIPMHQSSQSLSLNKTNQSGQQINSIHISSKISQQPQQQSIQISQLQQQQQQFQQPLQNNYVQQNLKNNYSSSNIQSQNSGRNQSTQNDQHQRKTSVNINISNLINSTNYGNSATSSNSKSANNNALNLSNNQNGQQQYTHQAGQQQQISQFSLNQQQIQHQPHQTASSTMSNQQAQQIQQQLQQFQQQQIQQQQFNLQQPQQPYSSTLDSEQQSKTYAQIIKDYLKNNGNSSRLSSTNTLTNNNSGAVSKNSSNQNTLKKSSTNIAKDLKPKNSSISSNPLTTKSNQTNGLEGRVFMLESKVLSLKQKTENLEKQNLNLTQELIRINEEKSHHLRENLENRQRIIELETITKKNEENISIILQMLQKSQSDYELLKYQKQEVSTNIFTDISCIDSPNEIQNQKVQKQVLLQNKNMNQILENGDQRYNGNQSYLIKDKEQKFQTNCNITNSGNFSNNQRGGYIQQQQAQMNANSNKYFNENSSFNSLLQQKKQQNTQGTKQNSQILFNTSHNINNILKPSNLNHQNQGRFSAYH